MKERADIDAIAKRYRDLRAPDALAPTLRAQAAERLDRRGYGGWWAAAAAAGVLVIAVGLLSDRATVPTAQSATSLPSLSQIRSRMPSTSLGGYRIPALGQNLRVPTLPSTPKRERRSDDEPAPRDEPDKDKART